MFPFFVPKGVKQMNRQLKKFFSSILIFGLFVISIKSVQLSAQPAYIDQAQNYQADSPTRTRPIAKTINTKKKSSDKKNKKGAEKQETEVVVVDVVSDEAQIALNDQLPADAVLVDKIQAVVFAQDGTKIITQSETNRTSLDGRVRTLEDLVNEMLMILDAQKFKMVADDQMIDRHLAAVQRENNLSLEDLKQIFKASGYTFEEGREQFGMISVINQLLDFKIRSRLIVPEKDVVAYYNAHPQEIDAQYEVEYAVIPYDHALNKDEQLQELEHLLKTKSFEKHISWQAPYWIEENELAEDKKFITQLAVGQVSKPTQGSEGFELFRLKAKKERHNKSLDDRYREISEFLRKPRYEQLLNEYKEQLRANSAVLYLD